MRKIQSLIKTFSILKKFRTENEKQVGMIYFLSAKAAVLSLFAVARAANSKIGLNLQPSPL